MSVPVIAVARVGEGREGNDVSVPADTLPVALVLGSDDVAAVVDLGLPEPAVVGAVVANSGAHGEVEVVNAADVLVHGSGQGDPLASLSDFLGPEPRILVAVVADLLAIIVPGTI